MSAFVLTDNQAMLAESARKYVERGYDAAVRKASLAAPYATAPERWREFAELGWLALALPEADGGLGGSTADLCVLGEELGRGLVVEPWLGSAVLAAGLLARAGTAAQRAAWAESLATGDKRLALAVWERGARFDATQVGTTALRDGAGWRIDGEKELVLGAGGADGLIVSARAGEATGLFLVPAQAPGVSIRAHALIDGTWAAQVRLSGVVLAEESRLTGGAVELERALDAAQLVHAAEAIGAMARAFEITLDYAKTRKQFGRAIAQYQAIQHRLVDLMVAIEEARALVLAAAHIDESQDTARRAHVAAACAYTAQAARLMWEDCVQLHGAIGMTDEYQLGAYVRRLARSQVLFGDAGRHLERLAQAEEAEHAAA